MNKLLILDKTVSEEMIRQRQRLGHDRYDEVWDGVYVMPPMPNSFHQTTIHRYAVVLDAVVPEDDGVIQEGANVSDRDEGWERNYRVPDIVVVLAGGRAVDRQTHWLGGPDFLVEVASPGDDTDEKIPFYSRIQVREVLIVQRDSRDLRLLRHDGNELFEVDPVVMNGKRWLQSEVLPLAFRRVTVKGKGPRTLVRRTDGKTGAWTV